MKRTGFVVLLALSLILLNEETWAQLNRSAIKQGNKRMAGYRGNKSKFPKVNRYNALGITLNAMNYYGDLSPSPSKFSTDLGFTKPAIGVSFTHRFGPRYTFMAQFLYGTISGSDAESAKESDPNNGVFRYKRNLSFRNRIKELSLLAYFDLFDNQSTYISRVQWTPYIYTGVSFFMHNPQAKVPDKDLQGNPLPEAGQWVDLRPLGTEGQYSQLSSTDANYGIKPYSLLQVAIPIGVGARFRINEVMDIWADVGFRYTFTDYLDDVSQNYVNLDKLSSPLAQAMSYRTNELYNGNPPNGVNSSIPGVLVEAGYGSEYPTNKRGGKNQNDIYMVTSVRLTYIINATLHKAKFR